MSVAFKAQAQASVYARSGEQVVLVNEIHGYRPSPATAYEATAVPDALKIMLAAWAGTDLSDLVTPTDLQRARSTGIA